MPYDPPEDIGDYGDWVFHEILYNGGTDSWSVVEGTWAGNRALGIRWNGGDTGEVSSFPYSRRPVWFIVPLELEETIRTAARVKRLWQERG